MNRYSTQSLKLSGANRVVRIVDGLTTTEYQSGTGTEPTTPIDGNVSYSTPAYISPTDYSVLLGYFMSRGSSLTHARTQILLALDVCTQRNITPIAFVTSQGTIYGDEISLIAQNNVRTEGLKVGSVINSSYATSKIARQVIV